MRPNIETVRYRAHSWLTDTATLTRPGQGQGEFNPETGEFDPPAPVVAYTGKVLVRPQNNAERIVEAGEATATVTRYDVTLPANTPVQNGDTLTVTACEFDAALVGTELTILDVLVDVWQVARRAVAARVT